MKNKELFEKLIYSDNREDWVIACSLLDITDMNYACHLLWMRAPFSDEEKYYCSYAYVRDFFYDLFSDKREFWYLWNKYKKKIYDNN